ncbi:MAG: LysR family transcriptional regulator [Bdellovibrionota bacterium]|nr:LysR family transcriptional regulator [Bdellovibrionota bacterium]
MSKPDFNLLITLDVLLTEGSVVGAARKLNLSPSAMSRALTRLRDTVGDPLLVRAGRGLVPTARALELQEKVRQLVKDSESILRPIKEIDLKKLKRTFVIETSDGFVENFGPKLINTVSKQAPGVTLRFMQKIEKTDSHLREGTVDLQTGVVAHASLGPELRVVALFEDQFIGVVRKGHPLSKGKITPKRYSEFSHIQVSRGGTAKGSIDLALEEMGMKRKVTSFVSGFSQSLSLAKGSQLVANVPEKHTGSLRKGLFSFPIPLSLPKITVSLIWHPRLDADPAHVWLRQCVRDICK